MPLLRYEGFTQTGDVCKQNKTSQQGNNQTTHKTVYINAMNARESAPDPGKVYIASRRKIAAAEVKDIMSR